jgi:hypothetical protein
LALLYVLRKKRITALMMNRNIAAKKENQLANPRAVVDIIKNKNR